MTSSSVLHDIIDRASIEPDQPAVKDLERELSYAELVDEVARLGAGLHHRGVVEGDRVALLIPNSVDFVVAALASLWVGALFVPLAVTDPQSRLSIVVADCSPVLVITSDQEENPQSALLGGASQVPIDLLREMEGIPVLETEDAARAAYMIYTSGTTGTPKGVRIGNAAFAAAVHSTANALGLDRATRTLCVSPFHFDGSYANLFTTLVSGGTVVIRPRDALMFPRTFFNTVAKENINYAGFTPSYLRLLLVSPQMEKLKDTSLGILALGGEASSVADIESLWAHAPDIRVFNRYGPTETTIAVTNTELTSEMIEQGVVTIGHPHPGVTFALVDDQGRVIDGTDLPGELYIGGVQLMDGYWADPELTKSVMRDDVVPGQSLYRSGDLVYRDDRGGYVYVDRVDRVVKRNGVRISLVELSASMSKLEDVVAATCLTFDSGGDLAIVAFVVAKTGLSALDLRIVASKLIPETMLPDRIKFVDSMPLNRSNMLDESRLLSEAGLRPYRPASSPSVPT